MPDNDERQVTRMASQGRPAWPQMVTEAAGATASPAAVGSATATRTAATNYATAEPAAASNHTTTSNQTATNPAATDSTTSAASHRPRPRPRLSTKRLTIALIAVVLVVDVLAVGLLLAARGQRGGTAEANPNPVELIHGQLECNHGQAIANITYHPELTFAAYPAGRGSTLRPISNNYLASVPDGGGRQVVLIDETAVGRLLSFNSDWVAYQNSGETAVFGNVLADSQAEQFVNQHDGFKIAFHRLAIGEISTDGKAVYVLAQPVYTLLKDGQAVTVSDVCLFVFVRQGDTLVLSGIEPQKEPSQDAGFSPTALEDNGLLGRKAQERQLLLGVAEQREASIISVR